MDAMHRFTEKTASAQDLGIGSGIGSGMGSGIFGRGPGRPGRVKSVHSHGWEDFSSTTSSHPHSSPD